jgi:predicted RNA polymerase sigma factor
VLIGRGPAALRRAEELGGALGPYALQTAIAACHAWARTAEETAWERIVALYDALALLVRWPVVELNNAIAMSMAYGPAEGLELVDALTSVPSLRAYHLLPSVRGDLLAGSDATARRVRSWSARRRSRATRASARYSSSGWRRSPTAPSHWGPAAGARHPYR